MDHTLSSVTTLTLTSTTGFDSSGTAHIGNEIISYTGAQLGNDLNRCNTRCTALVLHLLTLVELQVAQFE